MYADSSVTSEELVASVYLRLASRVETLRNRVSRPLTLVEKILANHFFDVKSGVSTTQVDLKPDRVILQDATAQMALLQFMTSGMDKVAVPTTVHCDHFVQAYLGANLDMGSALEANAEIYAFLRSASARYGIGFWEVGSGIIHQVVMEQYAFPGGMILGADSHSPHAGGVGTLAIGAGGAEVVEVMAGSSFGIDWPRIIGIRLTGTLQGWTSAKDVVLKVAGILTTSGGTGAILEYFGEGARSISATGKATICNMGAELGATSSVFPFDSHVAEFLSSVGRGNIAKLANDVRADLMADAEVEAEPDHFYDRIIEIDLSTLEPQIVGPHSPDRISAISEIGRNARMNVWPTELSACLVGSCTNSSYEDISRAASVARQASGCGLRVKAPLLVTPGSERIRKTLERDGLLKDLESIGATILANACGPCIGQWKRDDVSILRNNSIMTSYNRNFPKRNDGSPSTHAFIASPETVVAYSLSGTLNFNPLTDSVDGVVLEMPAGEELPREGFSSVVKGFIPPPDDGSNQRVEVRIGSERLEILEPFPQWDGSDFTDIVLLTKVKGKCTTDQISPGGSWLRYRGHLTKISANLFLGSTNAFTGEAGKGVCPAHGSVEGFPTVASHCKEAGLPWLVVGDENFGEGSSREHAAMEPRLMGCKAIIARSFARIAEMNLKMQGLLALRFENPADYDAIEETDRLSILGLEELAPGKHINCIATHRDGTFTLFRCTHTMSEQNIEWFKAGSSVNFIRKNLHSK